MKFCVEEERKSNIFKAGHCCWSMAQTTRNGPFNGLLLRWDHLREQVDIRISKSKKLYRDDVWGAIEDPLSVVVVEDTMGHEQWDGGDGTWLYASCNQVTTHREWRIRPLMASLFNGCHNNGMNNNSNKAYQTLSFNLRISDSFGLFLWLNGPGTGGDTFPMPICCCQCLAGFAIRNVFSRIFIRIVEIKS